MKGETNQSREETQASFYARGFYIKDDSFFYFDSQLEQDIEVPISSVLLIAEETTDAGPWHDDMFLLVITRNEEGFFRFPFETATTETLVNWFDDRLGPELSWRLRKSTVYANNIVWPHSLKGEPLMLPKKNIPVGVVQRFLGMVGLWKDAFSCEYTAPVKEYLQEMEQVVK